MLEQVGDFLALAGEVDRGVGVEPADEAGELPVPSMITKRVKALAADE